MIMQLGIRADGQCVEIKNTRDRHVPHVLTKPSDIIKMLKDNKKEMDCLFVK